MQRPSQGRRRRRVGKLTCDLLLSQLVSLEKREGESQSPGSPAMVRTSCLLSPAPSGEAGSTGHPMHLGKGGACQGQGLQDSQVLGESLVIQEAGD